MTIFFGILAVLLCVLAAVLEFACLREPNIPDNQLSIAGRRILIAGWALMSVRLSWMFMDGRPETTPSDLGLLALAMIAFANVVRCANRIVLLDRSAQSVIRHHSNTFFSRER